MLRVKKYLVDNMQEALQRIKEDLGEEVIIISSKKVRAGGIRGLLGAKVIEVTAALERKKPEDDIPVPTQITLEEARLQEDRRNLEKELVDMKFMLKKLLKNTGQGADDPVSRWKEILESLEINSSITDLLMMDLTENLGPETVNDTLIKEALKTRVAKLFLEIEENPHKRKVYAFVGPTGVGKTTTLAKLAALYAFSMGKKVGMITIDTYRIGAVEQLRTYGNIMGVGIDVVMTPEQLRDAVKKNQDKDIIFVDTAGRSSSDSMKLSEVKTFFSAIAPLEVYLVLSCTTKRQDLDRIAAEYKLLDYTRLIFTKVDETKTLGSILNVAFTTKTPVAYITNGQDVPDDIEIADPHKLAELILREVV